MVQTRRTAAAAAAVAAAATASANKDTTAATSTAHNKNKATATTTSAPTATTTTTAATTTAAAEAITKNNARFNAEAAAWDSNPFIQAMSAEAWRAVQHHVTCFRDSSDAAGPAPRPDVLEIGCGTGTLSLLVAPHARLLVAVDAAEGMVEVLKAKLADNAEANKAEEDGDNDCGGEEAGDDENRQKKKEKSRLPKKDFPKRRAHLRHARGPGRPQPAPGTQQQQQQQEQDQEKPAQEVGGRPDRIKFDLVLSHLVLHHIPDMAPVLRTMLGCLKPGGAVALTDFEDFGPAARKFHPEGKMEGVERHGIPRARMRELMREVGFADVRVEVAWTARKSVESFPGEFGDRAEGGEGKGEMMEFPFLICTGKRP
ncbi:S-adenosyl-L-methionine-dependent methyltransferase [Apiospora hydei]|uniref:S-adenosyl-L-methionine-dependent methyltransferase n=1 Tax=Apiospora hydei TaxID=1337664 RepID=A0ABR1WLC8_9PEZI